MSKPEADATAASERSEATSADLAGEEIVRALGPLAASPLTEQAAARMRRVLARAGSPAVRDALRRRLPADTGIRGVMPVSQAGGPPCRSPQAQPVTRFGPGRPGLAMAGAW